MRGFFLALAVAACLAGCSGHLSRGVRDEPWRCVPHVRWPVECRLLTLCLEWGECL